MNGSAQKRINRSKMPKIGKNIPNSLSRELLIVETCLTPHFVRKTHFSNSVSYILYLSVDLKWPKMKNRVKKSEYVQNYAEILYHMSQERLVIKIGVVAKNKGCEPNQ